MEHYLYLIPALPLFVAALLLVVGAILSMRKSPFLARWKQLSGWISVAGTAAALALALLALFSYRSGQPLVLNSSWFRVGNLTFPFSLQVDGLQGVMAVTVAAVSMLVHLFSIGYMHGDRDLVVYFAELSLFSGAMLMLVLAANFFLLYVSWELVGATSYLLISFYFERPAAAAAGKKAFLVTRLGDVGLLIAVFALVALTGNFGFNEVFGSAQGGALGSFWVTAVPLLIFAGAAGKSAQFPLHVWLPDAMEGPTPVSALIHAATMVAAGVYLVARTFPLFAASPAALEVVAWIGAFTALMAATIAVTQHDIKKMLAYSTISQLGFMMAIIGAGVPATGIFHLFTHAWFKALLFLAAGSIIHMTGRQTVDEVGRLARAMPVTAMAFVVGGLALSGIPPFAGFWSKEEILSELSRVNFGLFVVLLLATFLTAFYVFRVIFLVFWGPPAPVTAGFSGALVLDPVAEPIPSSPARPLGVEPEDDTPSAGPRPGGFEDLVGAEPNWRSWRPDQPPAKVGEESLPEGASSPPLGPLPAAPAVTRVHESPPVMTAPLLVLSFAALVAGFLGAPFLGSWLQGFLDLPSLHEELGGALWVTLLTVGLSLAAILLAWLGYGRERLGSAAPGPAPLSTPPSGATPVGWRGAGRGTEAGGPPPEQRTGRDLGFDPRLAKLSGPFYRAAAAGYGIDTFYNRVVVGGYVGLSRFLSTVVDALFIDGVVNGVGSALLGVGRGLRGLQSGGVRDYLAAMAVGTLVLAIVLWRLL